MSGCTCMYSIMNVYHQSASTKETWILVLGPEDTYVRESWLYFMYDILYCD